MSFSARLCANSTNVRCDVCGRNVSRGSPTTARMRACWTSQRRRSPDAAQLALLYRRTIPSRPPGRRRPSARSRKSTSRSGVRTSCATSTPSAGARPANGGFVATTSATGSSTPRSPSPRWTVSGSADAAGASKRATRNAADDAASRGKSAERRHRRSHRPELTPSGARAHSEALENGAERCGCTKTALPKGPQQTPRLSRRADGSRWPPNISHCRRREPHRCAGSPR